MDLKTNLDKKDDASFSLKVTVPSEEIKAEYQNLLQQQAKKLEIKGFRKGKAPLNLIEDKIGKDKLNDLLLEKVVQKFYPQAVKQVDLHPIIPPKVKLISAQEGKDWIISFVSTELPKVDLSDAEEKVKEANAQSKIWTPDKATKKKDEEETENKDKQIQKIINILIKNVKVNLPDILIEQELNRKLVNLIDQINQTGLKLNQYLETKGTTIEEIKKQYRQEIINNWKIDLALEKLADKENIEVSEKDTQKIEKSKINPYLAAKIMRRQKTLEYLLSL